MGMGGYAIVVAPLGSSQKVESANHYAGQNDAMLCRAKFANWLMRYEELAKPEPERWRSFVNYMRPECLNQNEGF